MDERVKVCEGFRSYMIWPTGGTVIFVITEDMESDWRGIKQNRRVCLKFITHEMCNQIVSSQSSSDLLLYQLRAYLTTVNITYVPKFTVLSHLWRRQASGLPVCWTVSDGRRSCRVNTQQSDSVKPAPCLLEPKRIVWISLYAEEIFNENYVLDL